jgi:hypothetical protein
MSKRIYAQYKFLFFSQIVLVAITIIFVLTLIVPLIEPFLVPGALGEVGLRGLLNFAMDNLDLTRIICSALTGLRPSADSALSLFLLAQQERQSLRDR